MFNTTSPFPLHRLAIQIRHPTAYHHLSLRSTRWIFSESDNRTAFQRHSELHGASSDHFHRLWSWKRNDNHRIGRSKSFHHNAIPARQRFGSGLRFAPLHFSYCGLYTRCTHHQSARHKGFLQRPKLSKHERHCFVHFRDFSISAALHFSGRRTVFHERTQRLHHVQPGSALVRSLLHSRRQRSRHFLQRPNGLSGQQCRPFATLTC